MAGALGRVVATSGAPLYDVAAALLRFLRDRAADYRELLDQHDAMVRLVRYRRSLVAWLARSDVLDGLDDELLDLFGDQLDAIVDEAARAIGEGRALVLVARAGAEAIDKHAGNHYWEHFRLMGDVELASGDPCPVPPLDRKALFSGSLTTNPDGLGPLIDRTRSLSLMPASVQGLKVVYSSVFIDHVSGLSGDSQIALVSPPPLSLDDWDFTVTDGVPPRFFNVRPKNAAEIGDALRASLGTAAAAGAQIAVMPELCLDEERQRALGGALDELPGDLELLVAGSVHTTESGKARNAARLYARTTSHEAQHHKFNRFIWKHEGVAREEGIDVSPSVVRIFAAGGSAAGRGRSWTFVPLICKDLLQPGVSEILKTLRVSMVLLASLSDVTESFEKVSGELAQASQTIVAAANHTLSQPDPAFLAWLQRPTRDDPITCVRVPDAPQGACILVPVC